MIESVANSLRRFRLTDPAIENDTLAQKLKLERKRTHDVGFPDPCFYFDNGIVAGMRLSETEIGIYHPFSALMAELERDGIGIVAPPA